MMSIESQDLADLARIVQAGFMVVGLLASLAFIAVYSRFWDYRIRAARWVMALNVAVVMAFGSVVLGRIFPATPWIEIVKAVMLGVVATVLIVQYSLLRAEKNPDPPPKG